MRNARYPGDERLSSWRQSASCNKQSAELPKIDCGKASLGGCYSTRNDWRISKSFLYDVSTSRSVVVRMRNILPHVAETNAVNPGVIGPNKSKENCNVLEGTYGTFVWKTAAMKIRDVFA
jgi:hypothetical protein